MNKKGVSAIVATVLIILLTITSIMIIWALISSYLKLDSLENIDLRLDVLNSKGYTVCDPVDRTFLVQVKRGPDEYQVDNIRLIFDFAGNTISEIVPAPAPMRRVPGPTALTRNGYSRFLTNHLEPWDYLGSC